MIRFFLLFVSYFLALILTGCGSSFEQPASTTNHPGLPGSSPFSSRVEIQIERGRTNPGNDSLELVFHPASDQVVVGENQSFALEDFLRQHNLSPSSPRDAELVFPVEDHHQVQFLKVTDIVRNDDGSLTVSAHIDEEREVFNRETSPILAQTSGPVVLVVSVVEEVSGIPQVGATVTVGSTDGDGSEAMTVSTDTQGMATFAAFSSNGSVSYQVQVSDDDFATQTKRVTIAPGRPQPLLFELTGGDEAQTVDGGSLVLQ